MALALSQYECTLLLSFVELFLFVATVSLPNDSAGNHKPEPGSSQQRLQWRGGRVDKGGAVGMRQEGGGGGFA